jgi:NAD(P)-dependent dehydrogenase (short-subunit alcohol dehydrogenase family)
VIVWALGDIPTLTGRVALVTGGNSGIGLETAMVLAVCGATVVVAGRDPDRIATAARGIGAESLRLDLADLASVRSAAAEFKRRYDRLDLLINNAGVMNTPYRLTADGFELQFGVNHLGHFALTGLLIDRLDGGRVVTVSSNAHRRATIDFTDLDGERAYDPMGAYARSKLANLLFAVEVHRRCPWVTSVAAHPGAARTALMRHSPWHFRFVASPRTRWLFSWLIQSEQQGALPTLRAATDPAVRGGDYYGPDGWGEFTGRPIRVAPAPQVHDSAVAAELWATSQRLTGVTWPLAAGMLSDGP